MHMQDLSRYQYHHCDGLPGVLPVGWLSIAHDYQKGPVARPLLDKLTYLAVFKSINFMRGAHRCELCDDGEPVAEKDGAVRSLGSAEVWLPGDNVLYAAPNLIVHYISVHRYQPPQSYLDAVDALDVDEWAPPRDYVSTHRSQPAPEGRE